MKYLVTFAVILFSNNLHAGAFLFAGEDNGIDIITHPSNYTGTSGVVEVNVCINPNSVNANDLVVSTLNIINTFNELQGFNNNLVFGGANNIPSGQIDWESVTLHEVGHCLGLAHPNLGAQTGVSGSNTNYTNSTNGVDDVFNFNDGSDNIIGSGDDTRGDDQNLFWFNDNINNPFIASPPFDATTYTRELADLPNGDNFAANPDVNVAADLGFANSEGVMQQGTRSDEDQRLLGVDDVSTLKLAMSGLDETANTNDDYTIRLVYGGLANNCDINIYNDPNYEGFARCNVGGFFLNNTHLVITTGDIQTNPNTNWFFNDVLSDIDLIFEDGFE